MKIYAIEGEAGSYSDYSAWVLSKAYRSRESAEAAVLVLEAGIKQIRVAKEFARARGNNHLCLSNQGRVVEVGPLAGGAHPYFSSDGVLVAYPQMVNGVRVVHEPYAVPTENIVSEFHSTLFDLDPVGYGNLDFEEPKWLVLEIELEDSP